MVFDSKLYAYTKKNSGLIFYQPSIVLRRKALLGIIVSDTNPDRPKLRPMRFRLTSENLDEVVAKLKRAGYFQE